MIEWINVAQPRYSTSVEYIIALESMSEMPKDENKMLNALSAHVAQSGASQTTFTYDGVIVTYTALAVTVSREVMEHEKS
jgi:hypothetical protein